MCPAGHELLGQSDRFWSRLRWAWHARRCAACADARGALHFLDSYAARASDWPVPATLARPAPRHNRRIAAAAAAVLVLLVAVPLLGPMVRKPEPPRFQNPPANADRVWTVTASVPQAKDIRTVRFVVGEGGTRLLPGMPPDQVPVDAWDTVTFSREYPDKERRDPSMPATEGTGTRNGDREFGHLPGGLQIDAVGPYPERRYHYELARPEEPLPSPDLFTDQGVEQAGLVCSWHGQDPPYSLGQGGDIFVRHWEAGTNGERVLVVKHTKRDDPAFLGTYRTRIDPATHLVRGWDNQVHWMGRPGRTLGEKVPHISREVVESVEYNVTFPEGTFDTAVPAGAAADDVLDWYTPAGLKERYLFMIGVLPYAKAKLGSQEGWAEHLQVLSHAFSRLDVLSPADQAEVREKAKEQGLDLP